MSFTGVQAQPYYFRHYQVENGLSNNTVFCSIQDKDGFLWFGTKEGLNRFDGYRFKLFKLDKTDKRNPQRDFIYCLFTDPAGTFRASTYAANIDWGDDSTSAGTVVSLGGGTFAVEGDHTYDGAGRDVIVVRVVSAAGDSGTVASAATVTQPALTVEANGLIADDAGFEYQPDA